MNPGDRVTITCKPNGDHHYHPEIREKRAAMNGKTGEVVTIATLSGDVLVETDGVRSWFWPSELSKAPSAEAELRDELANEKAAHAECERLLAEERRLHVETKGCLYGERDTLRDDLAALRRAAVRVTGCDVDADTSILLAGLALLPSFEDRVGIVQVLRDAAGGALSPGDTVAVLAVLSRSVPAGEALRPTTSPLTQALDLLRRARTIALGHLALAEKIRRTT